MLGRRSTTRADPHAVVSQSRFRWLSRLLIAGSAVAVVASSVAVASAQPPPTPPVDPQAPAPGQVFFEKKVPVEVQDQDVPGIAAKLADPNCLNDRFNSCKYYQERVEQWVRDTPSSPPRLFGAWAVYFTFKSRSIVQDRRSTITFQGSVEVASGEPVPGNLTISIEVQEPNVGAGRSIRTVSMGLYAGATGSDQVAYFSPIVNNYQLRTQLQYTWNSQTPVPPEVPGPTTRMTQNYIRCDTAQEVNYGTGCVNPAYLPIANFPVGTYPYISPNIQADQADTQRGAPGISALHRNSPSEVDANRNAACSTARQTALGPPPTGMDVPSCDEYPFASTQEGGSTSRIAWVPLAENNTQGNTLIDFYRQSRVMTGDAFYVQP